MTLQLKIWTVEEVHEKFFKGHIQPKALEELVVESRCYRELGKKVLLTDRDITDFITWLSPRSKADATPSDIDVGQLVVIGNPLSKESFLYVAWCPPGRELAVLDRVRVGYPERVMILATIDMTFGSAREFCEGLRAKKLWHMGSLYMHPALELIEALQKETTTT